VGLQEEKARNLMGEFVKALSGLRLRRLQKEKKKKKLFNISL